MIAAITTRSGSKQAAANRIRRFLNERRRGKSLTPWAASIKGDG
jgi:hypothetical protein